MANSSDPKGADTFDWAAASAWGALALGILVIVLYGVSVATPWSASDPLGQHAEAPPGPDPALFQQALNRALDQAWEVLGGHGGNVLFSELTHDRDRLARAGQLIDGVLASRPNDSRAHMLQGLRLLASGDEDGALRSVERSLETGGGHQSLLVLGTLHTHVGDLDQAEAVFRRGVEEYPNSPAVWNNLGQVLWQLGRQDEAEAAYRRKLELEEGPKMEPTSAETPAAADDGR